MDLIEEQPVRLDMQFSNSPKFAGKNVVSVFCRGGFSRGEQFKNPYAIPEDISAIGDDACVGLWNVKEIYVPANVTSIGFEAFVACNG